MNAIIIRFEGHLAICRKETKTIIEINRNLLPANAEEGDVLQIIGRKISINTLETSKRKDRVKELWDDILKN